MAWIAPELATLVKEPFSDPAWVFEEKFDGIRCVAVKERGKVSLFSRDRKSLNRDFPGIREWLEQTKSPDFVIDGEIVALENKVSSFSKLQRRKIEAVPVFYYVFDLMEWGGERTTALPLLERKRRLKQKFPFGGAVRYTPHVAADGKALFRKAQQRGWEGIIAKRGEAHYVSRRTRDWLKCKCVHQQEFVIGGYTEPKRSRVGFGALLVGYYEKGRLRYAGKVGTGYDAKLLSHLSKKLASLQRATCPFSTVPNEKTAHFVTPCLVCEVSFTEWTGDNKLRHPSFLGLRTDKAAGQVRSERG